MSNITKQAEERTIINITGDLSIVDKIERALQGLEYQLIKNTSEERTIIVTSLGPPSESNNRSLHPEKKTSHKTDAATRIGHENSNLAHNRTQTPDTPEKEHLHKQHAEQNYLALVEKSPVSIIVVRDTKIIYANQTATKKTGYTQQEIEKLTFMDLVASSELERVIAGWERRDDLTGTDKIFDLKIISKSNKAIYTQVFYVDIVWNRKPAHLFYLTDITTRQKAERALKASELKFRTVVENINEGLAITNQDLKLTYVNTRACEMIDVDKSELIGIKPISFIAPRNLPDVKQHFDTVINGSTATSEVEILKKDGTVLNTILSSTPIIEKGKLSRLVSILTDITYLKHHRHLLELEVRKRTKELVIAKKEAEDSNRMKSEFLANVTHELRTPLHGIIGLSEVIKEGKKGFVSEDQVSTLDLIINFGKRLSVLINNILDYSKIKTRDLDIFPETVHIYPITETILELLSMLFRKKHIQLINQVSKSISPVRADENRLQQILLNVISNAFKFTERGQITIDAIEEDAFVAILISDTGIGIPRQNLDRIFNEFEQLSGSTNREYSGTGLGLALTKRLVELHQGTIDVTSELGKGSTFKIRLPIAHPHMRRIPPSTKRSSFQKKQNVRDGIDVPDNPKNYPVVLIVDDDPINIIVINNYLREENLTIIEAFTGDQALSYIDNHDRPDLVLLDVMMPRLSGFEVCRQIRKRYSSHELPIIFLSARNQLSDITEGFSLGANDYVTKPFSKGELLPRIRLHLNLNRGSGISNQRMVALNQFFNDPKRVANDSSLFDAIMELIRDHVYATQIFVFQNGELVFPLKPTRYEKTTAYLRDMKTVPDENPFLIGPDRKSESSGWILGFKIESLKTTLFTIYRDGREIGFNQADLVFIKNLIDGVYQIRQNARLLINDDETLHKYLNVKSRLRDICLICADGQASRIYYIGDRDFTDIDWSLKDFELYFSEESLLRIHRSFIINPNMNIKASRPPGRRDYTIRFSDPDIDAVLSECLNGKEIKVSRKREYHCRKRYPQWFE